MEKYRIAVGIPTLKDCSLEAISCTEHLKIEDSFMSCDGVFFTHHGIRYFYSDDCNKFYCTTFLSDFLESFKNDLSNEFLYIVYGPDIRSNAVEESKYSEIPCERRIHSYICKYKEDFEKTWKSLKVPSHAQNA